MNTLADFFRRAPRMLEQGSEDQSSAYWSIAADVLLTTLQASPDGLQGSASRSV